MAVNYGHSSIFNRFNKSLICFNKLTKDTAAPVIRFCTILWISWNLFSDETFYSIYSHSLSLSLSYYKLWVFWGKKRTKHKVKIKIYNDLFILKYYRILKANIIHKLITSKSELIICTVYCWSEILLTLSL